MRRSRQFGLALLVVVPLIASVAAAGTAGAAGLEVTSTTSTTTTIAPGLTLTKIQDPVGPQQIRVLTFDPSKPVTLDVNMAGASIPAYQTTSAQAANRGALAAINGDFSIDPGRPLHPWAEDGYLRQTGFQNGASFAISKDETHLYSDVPKIKVTGLDVAKAKTFTINEWNTGDPAGGEIAGYSTFGGNVEVPPSNACSARLLSSGKMVWSGAGTAIAKDYKVDAVKCQSASMALKGGIVISAKETSFTSNTIKDLLAGKIVTLTWSFGWTGVMDSVGGMPLLVSGGTVLATACGSYFCERNPRSGIGITADNKVLLVTVDGRCTCAAGMTLVAFANEMKSLGAVWALNLDGGGGATMWVKGQGIVNRPSDSTGERPVTNTVLILPGTDTGEPTPAFVSTAGTGSALTAEQAGQLAAGDPASTGGLLDAMASGNLGPVGPLPPALAQVAQQFRATYSPSGA